MRLEIFLSINKENIPIKTIKAWKTMYTEKKYYLFIHRLKLSVDWTRRISLGWMGQGVFVCVILGGFPLPVLFKKVLLSLFFPPNCFF